MPCPSRAAGCRARKWQERLGLQKEAARRDAQKKLTDPLAALAYGMTGMPDDYQRVRAALPIFQCPSTQMLACRGLVDVVSLDAAAVRGSSAPWLACCPAARGVGALANPAPRCGARACMYSPSGPQAGTVTYHIEPLLPALQGCCT